jgi:hypothetical protein
LITSIHQECTQLTQWAIPSQKLHVCQEKCP